MLFRELVFGSCDFIVGETSRTEPGIETSRKRFSTSRHREKRLVKVYKHDYALWGFDCQLPPDHRRSRIEAGAYIRTVCNRTRTVPCSNILAITYLQGSCTCTLKPLTAQSVSNFSQMLSRFNLISRAMSASTATTAVRQQFLLIAHDYTDPDAFARRMAARQNHLENVKKLAKEGRFITGGAILSDTEKIEGKAKMIGSMLLLKMGSKEEVEEYAKNDPYSVGKVWEKVRSTRPIGDDVE